MPVSYSAVAAISVGGILDAAVVPGSHTTSSLMEFAPALASQMQPFPGPRSVLVVDGASIHNAEFSQYFTQRGIVVLYLPPYSPWLNPIEFAFSKVKALIRRAHVDAVHAPVESIDIPRLLYRALFSITPSDCVGWIQHCGYSP